MSWNADTYPSIESPDADSRHGSAKDRGRADKWYRRDRDPHFYVGGSYTSQRIGSAFMSAGEVEAYNSGYDETEDEQVG